MIGDLYIVPDPYTWDIRDRVPRPRREPPNRDSYVAGARPTTCRASRRAEAISGHHDPAISRAAWYTNRLTSATARVAMFSGVQSASSATSAVKTLRM